MFEGVLNQLNVSQSMSKYICFDINKNFTITLVFTVIFRIHYNFFIVLPIRLKVSTFFSFLQGKTCVPKKSGVPHGSELVVCVIVNYHE